MYQVALKMLFGDLAKYLGLVFGVAFSTLLVNQQAGIFVGLITRGGSLIQDIPEADIWVMDPGVKNLDTSFPLRDTELARVRGVTGLDWAVPFFKSSVTVRTANGELEGGLLLGLDDTTLIGIPQKFVLGSQEDLRQPDAVAVSAEAYRRIWPGEKPTTGKILELNDRRAVVMAVVDARPQFTSSLTFYSRYSRALMYAPTGRNKLSFILARSNPGSDPQVVCDEINKRTGLKALTSEQFRWKCIEYILKNTGIPVSFAAVIGLGIIVGVAIVGLLLNLLILENLRQYAALKAIGVRNSKLVKMVLLQALVVGGVGYGFGLGGAASFFEFAGNNDPNFKGFYLPWQVAAGSAVLAASIMILSALFSLRKVLFVDPAIVFRG